MADMTYIISTGEFYMDEKLLEKGYSGYYNVTSKVDYRNDPFAQCVKDRGPIPVGRYYMSDGNNRKTKYSIKLTPVDITAMCNRVNFLIHGDSIHVAGTASEGCIILGLTSRQEILKAIRSDGTSTLEVRHGVFLYGIS